MGQTVQIGDLADAVMETLEEYADLAAEDVKQAVRDAGETVKKEIRANAPKDTGDYAKSWAVKKTKENGGRVAGKAHIAPAEEKGIRQLEEEIERSLRDG